MVSSALTLHSDDVQRIDTGARAIDGHRLARLFSPRSICIIGASSNPSTIAGRPQTILTQHGFTGAIYPVNPRHELIHGLRCYPNVTTLPEPPDVAIVVVGAGKVPAVIDECGVRGVRNAIVISSGFEEDSAGGDLVKQLKALAKRHEINVVGPNSEGVWSVPQRAMMTFGSAARRPTITEGRVSVISQSGSIGGNTARGLQDRGLGCRYFISAGNESILTAADYLDFLVDDGGSDVVLLFLEGIVEGRRFIAAAQRARDAGVVVVALKAGSSELGGATAASHTGKITSPADVYADIFNQVGVVQVTTVGDLVEAADVFLTPRLRLPAEPTATDAADRERIGVALVAPGATRTVMADAAERHGVPLATFSDTTVHALSRLIPSYGYARNPVDVTAQVSTAGMFDDVLDLMADDEATEAVVIQWGNRGIQHFSEVVETGEALHRRSGKPVLIGLLGNPWELNAEQRSALRARGISCAMAPEDVMKQLDWLYTRRRFDGLRRSGATELELRAPIQSMNSGRGFDAQAPWLLGCGFTVPASASVKRGQPYREFFADSPLRFPIAVKAHPDEVSHKADRNLVVLGVETAERAAAEVEEMFERAPDIASLLLQEMVPQGVEALVTVRDDDNFGPVLTVGVGGHLIELVNDVSHAAVPLSRGELDSMIDRNRLRALLAGVRGRPPADREAFCAAVLHLANSFPGRSERIAEIELNPVIVGPAGTGAHVVDSVIVNKQVREHR